MRRQLHMLREEFKDQNQAHKERKLQYEKLLNEQKLRDDARKFEEYTLSQMQLKKDRLQALTDAEHKRRTLDETLR